MELEIFDTNLNSLGIFDTFSSLIWTDRYYGYGDFEIVTPITMTALLLLQNDYYLTLKESSHVMIIESIEIKSNADTGDYLLVKGRSFESILDRRIVQQLTILYGNFQTEMFRLLHDNTTPHPISNRTFPLFCWEDSFDPAITSLTIDLQVTGNSLYDVIQKLCQLNSIGFKIRLMNVGERIDYNRWQFEFYSGTDRSRGQTINNYVIFSPEFDNLISTDYYYNKQSLKTAAIVAGEGEGIDRRIKIIDIPGLNTGFLRREIYIDARDISSNVDGGILTEEEYNSKLEERGYESLLGKMAVETFDAQIDATKMFIYGRDFFMGDILQFRNKFGQSGRVRVVELILSENQSGINIYPTFNIINE